MGFCGSKSNAMSVKGGVIQNECFVDVLNIIPHSLLLLVCTFILTVWNHSVIGKFKVKTWVHYQGHNFRWICTLALITTLIVEVSEGIISDLNNSDDSTNYHAFVPQCVAFFGALLSIIFYHNVEMWNSPRFLMVLLLYWPAALVLKSLKALSIYRNNFPVHHLNVWLTFIDIFFYILLMLTELNVLRCQKYTLFKRSRRMRPPADLENTRFLQSYVNFLSKSVYWWVNDLLIKGFKYPLTLKDLGKLPQSEKSSRMYKKVQIIFEEEKYKASQKGKSPSLFYSFFRATWPMLIVAGVFRLVGDLMAFVGPLLIEQIVVYAYTMQDDNSDPVSAASNQTKHFEFVSVHKFFENGYVLSVILLIANVLHHTFLQNHHFLVIREGIRIRTALQAMIYSKALRLSSLVITNGITTIGQIMNHMSIDTTFIMYIFFFIHFIWAIPIQIALTLLLMYYKMGMAALIGGLAVILAAPTMYFLGLGMAKLQKKVLLHSDIRIKKITEMIQGMKVIKLLAWEKGLLNSILEVRHLEMFQMFLTTILKAFMGFVGITSPVIGALLTFALYPMFESKPLSAGAAMSVLALLNLLQGPLQLMTLLSATIANAKVSLKRVLPYLLAQEVGRQTDSFPSFSKSCSILDSAGPSGHGLVEKLDSVVSLDGKLPTFELQSMENKSCRSSICSNSSVKLPLTPSHSRQGSGDSSLKNSAPLAESLGRSGSLLSDSHKRTNLCRNATSSELLDVKTNINLLRKSSAPALAVSELTGDYKRRRHFSNRSMDEDDAAIEDSAGTEPQNILEVQSGQFSWGLGGGEIALKDVNIKIPSGKLTVIVGQVGSGKSSLLSALLGEMTLVSGNIQKSRNANIAYVSQKPWLLNATLKDNILFGKPFVWRKYRRVISACVLQPDLELLPSADNTEIGEKGINLSGGQKQRVAMARALYSEAELIFLDDPLSALDSHVGKHVMDEAILKRLVKRNKTVIMVTHHLQYLSHAHQVIVMSNGHVHFHGKVGDVKKSDPDLYEIWRKAIRDAKAAELSHKLETGDSLALERKHSGGSQVSHDAFVRPASAQSQLSVPGLPGNLIQSGRKMSAMSVMTEASNEEASYENGDLDNEDSALKPPSDQVEDKGKLIKQENRETGAVTASVYWRYFKACSFTLCFVSVILQLLFHSLIVGSNFWLSKWASDADIFSRNASKYTSSNLHSNNSVASKQFDHSPYLMTYVYLCLGAVVSTLVGCLVINHAGFIASKNLFVVLLENVIRLPMRFFDTNPSGRILNRFTSDVSAIDQRLGGHCENMLRCVFFTLSAVIVNTITTPFFLCAAVPFFIFYYLLQRFYRATSRELQRLDSITKSPIFSHFSETINGLEVIRAYGVQADFKRRAFKAIDSNVAPFLFIQTANRWLGIRLDYMSSLLVFIAAVVSLSSGMNGMENPALVGLSITYALIVSGQLNWIVRVSAEVEMSMNSVERVVEYSDIPVEPSVISDVSVGVSESWPSEGKIEFNYVSLSYDVELEPVLHDASFTIQGGEKIGICGRTGSGKSSTALGLFRLLEITNGTICIDGVDITQVDLTQLRSRLAIIPQDPVLFQGTIRFNLDPNCQFKSDEVLWSALESVEMKETVSAWPDKLDTVIVDGGDNVSVGQRQLLCMARAFLRKAKIIIMDEATSAIDLETDNKIQHIIHSSALDDRTVITIAHRISTIMKYDKVMVIEYGSVREFAPPAELMTNEESAFYGLVHWATDHDLK